jgi:hypothetical protein
MKKQNERQPVVQFDADIVIYEFAMRMGDNPAVSAGCPIAMASKHQNCEVRNFEMYEYTRNLERKQKQQQKNRNRNSTKRSSLTSSSLFMIPVEQRSQILLRAGYSIQAIAKTILRVQTIKDERLETLRKSGWDNFAMLAMDSGKVPKGILKAALGTTGDIWAATIGSGVVVVGKQLTKAFSHTQIKTMQARSA